MVNLDKVVVVNVDSLLARGNILELIDISVSKGSVDILDNKNISDLDVLIGDYELEKYDTPKISLDGTEPLVIKLGEILLNEEIASTDECFDIRSTLSFISGSSGYRRCKSVLEGFQDWELSMLVAWIYAMHTLQFASVSELSVGIEADEDNYRQSSDMKIKVSDVIAAYQLTHSYRGEKFIESTRITVIPAWYWIQNLKKSKSRAEE